jgi:hypothetical protein
MMKDFKNRAIPVEKMEGLPPEQREGKIAVGALVDIERPRYMDAYMKICERAQKAAGEER